MDTLTCLLMNATKDLKSNLTKSLKPFNLTCKQAIVLRSLKEGSLSAKAVGQSCSIDKATLSAILDKLIDHGYISYEKNEDDKREKIYSMTKSGLNIIPSISQVEKSCMNKYESVLSKDEYEQMISSLKKISDLLR